MTFHNPSGAAIARLPNAMTVGQEFLRLMALKRQIEDRLDILAGIIDPTYPEAIGKSVTVTDLPRSGLAQAAPGVLLFKGGARHEA